MEILSIIQARGGSKGLYRKNIQNFLGYPLISYSIVAAKQSKFISRIIVSTEDTEIKKISNYYGAETPFIRPTELADDITTDYFVINHAVNWLIKNENYKPDLIVQLNPTAPLRKIGLIDDVIKKTIENVNCDSSRVVINCPISPYKLWQTEEVNNASIKPVLISDKKNIYELPRQILPKLYWHPGQIDCIKINTLINKKSLTGDNVMPYLIDEKYGIHIHSIEDILYAEWLVNTYNLNIIIPN